MVENCRLPDEVLSIVFSYCDKNTCLNGIGVACKKFRSLAARYGWKQSIIWDVDSSGVYALYKANDDSSISGNCRMLLGLSADEHVPVPQIQKCMEKLPLYYQINRIELSLPVRMNTSFVGNAKSVVKRHPHLFKIKEIQVFTIGDALNNSADFVLLCNFLDLFVIPGVTTLEMNVNLTGMYDDFINYVQARNLLVKNWSMSVTDANELEKTLKNLLTGKRDFCRNGSFSVHIENYKEEEIVSAMNDFADKAAGQGFHFNSIVAENYNILDSKFNMGVDAPVEVYNFKKSLFLFYGCYASGGRYEIRRAQKFANIKVKLEALAPKDEEWKYEWYTANIIAKKKILFRIFAYPDLQDLDQEDSRILHPNDLRNFKFIPNYQDDDLLITYHECSPDDDGKIDLEWLAADSLWEQATEVDRIDDSFPFTIRVTKDS
ncbi:hypothetical protein QR680_015488 [Steinernema hermaphroditum]|uniref:F-box domain-containing protein n=1 Tax=Steinernema hermaphroditum TaxID=289476 RepID=A0AA39H8Y7_9BILA|nr:hypothetical protein QR680_015488 [Steinernema hermaphroditum]